MSEALFNAAVKKPSNFVFRRLFIKRRLLDTGRFESEWQEITEDVKRWGKIRQQIDSVRLNKYQFSPMSITLANNDGKYNPNDFDNSLWFGFGNRQRTLVKVEAGFVRRVKGTDGIWRRFETPSTGKWNQVYWNQFNWNENPIVFKGFISGDIDQSDQRDVKIQVAPLLEVFRQYSARNLGVYNDSLTASKFLEGVRDHTDFNGDYIFRPFFDDTTANFDINTTTNEYANLNTSSAKDVIDRNVWDVATRLAEAENYVLFVSPDGKLKFKPRESNTTTAAFEFHGAGSFDREYGLTIKQIKRFGPKFSKYYSRVQVKHIDADTETSYEVVEATLSVADNSAAWQLGERTYQVENFWIPTASVAETIAQNIFDDVSALKREIDLEASFVPKLSVFDRVKITYNTSEISYDSLWDVNLWADTSGAATTGSELIWDPSRGDAIKLYEEEFNTLKIDLDLDKLTTNFVGRET